MTDTSQSSGDRSARIGGNAGGATVQASGHNPAGVPSQSAMLPPSESVNMRAELMALRETLTRLESPERRKIANALSDAEDELVKRQPDKNEVGKALERALDYARKAAGFPRVIVALRPHLTRATAWLGEHGHRLPEFLERTDDTRTPMPVDRHIRIGADAAGHTVLTGNGTVDIIQTTWRLELDDSPATVGPNPYQGLAAFTEQEADRFFGREALTQTLWEMFRRLYEPQPEQAAPLRLLPILGPAGCGKSSLARAGLLPELARQPLAGLQQLRVAVLTPGAHPIEALAGALARLATGDPVPVTETRACAEALRTPDIVGSYDGLSRIATALPGMATAPLIVLIDQYEELYALCEDTAAQDVFVANLLYAAADRAARVSVILTLRSDCLEQTHRHAALNQAIATHGVIVPAMDAAALRLAIAAPAAQANCPFDAASVDLLLAATLEHAGALPLLQFALTRIWEWLAQGVAPADTLRHIGGVDGALAGEAQRLYDSLSEADQTIAQRAFSGLVRLGVGTPDTRRRIAVADLTAHGEHPDHVREVLRLFARPGTRLITFAANTDGMETVEITHEALFEHWETLQTWLARGRAERQFPLWVEAEVQSRVEAVEAEAQSRVEAMEAEAQSRVEAMEAEVQSRVEAEVRSRVDAVEVEAQSRIYAVEAEAQSRVEAVEVEAQSRVEAEVQSRVEAVEAEAQSRVHAVEAEAQSRVEAMEAEVRSRVDAAVQAAFVPASVRQEQPAKWLPRAVSTALIALTLVASGIALVAWQAQRTAAQGRERSETARYSAEQERDKARRRFNDVRTLANAFMFDLHDAIEPLAGSTPARILVVKKALEYLDSLIQEAHDDAALQRDLAVSYSKIGDTLAAMGDTAGALEQHRKGLAIREELAQAEPTNAQAQRDVSTSYNKIGDTLAATGDTAGALEQYHKILTILEALVKAEPTNTQAPHDASISYNKIGDTLAATGNIAGALEQYGKGLAIRERLARAEPANAQARRDVAVSSSKTGIVLEAIGDTAGASKHYSTALPIFEALAKAEPTNAQARQDLAQIQKLWEALKSKTRRSK